MHRSGASGAPGLQAVLDLGGRQNFRHFRRFLGQIISQVRPIELNLYSHVFVHG